MYIYHFNYWKKSGVICRKYEVVKETEKCYFTQNSRILKDEINKLSQYSTMYCLSSDEQIFRQALIDKYNRTILHCKADIEQLEEMIEELTL